MSQRSRLKVEIRGGIDKIGQQAWQALDLDDDPFMSYAFLSLLEEVGCVGAATGWEPAFISAWDERGALVGALPMYLKMNSEGEFVFDWSWADAAYRVGVNYYPKGLIAAPFTPATGPRLLVSAALDAASALEVKRALLVATCGLTQDLGLSSMHFNFLTQTDREACEAVELPIRYGLQYHWYNDSARGHGERAPYKSFDAFLERFRAKRRANLRRERRKLEEAGVTTRVVMGSQADAALMDKMYRYYSSTVEKFHWGRQYLNHELFRALPSVMGDTLHMVVASQGGEDFAGALNFLGARRLYGRYWGCSREVEFAHFEVCMYAPITWCIEHGIEVFEPGAGGEHKFERGFEPTITYSAHLLRDPRLMRAVTDFLAMERAAVERRVAQLGQEESVLK